MFWNDRERHGLHFLDCPLIVECESSKSALSGRDLRYFATTLADKGRSSDIIVVLSGVAGKETAATAGFSHMTAALTQGVSVLLVTREDLLSLVTSQVLNAGAASI